MIYRNKYTIMMMRLKSVTWSNQVSDSTAELHLYLLGPPEVRLGDMVLSFPTRKTLALLVYLALEGRQLPREHLASLFWPESTSERSYASLRNTLLHLQNALRCASNQLQNAFLSATHLALALNPEAGITIDLHTVERAYTLARADRSNRVEIERDASPPALQAASELYRGDFMVGFSLSDAPDFDDWASNQREVWRRRLGLIFDRFSEIQYAQGDFISTAESASRWITLDPLNESAYRRKMRAHFAAGQRGQALETYELCRAVLMDELAIEPAPDTAALAERIRTQQPLQNSVSNGVHIDTPAIFLEHLFRGRGEEHRMLVDRYTQAASGKPQVVVIRGEIGIGKTRLASEFLNWADAQGAKTLRGRAFESGSRTVYLPLVEAIRPLFNRNGELAEWMGEVWLTPLYQLLPELHARIPELSGTAAKIKIDKAHLFEALVRLTLSLSESQPLVLFVDDLQWADQATLDWLVYAIRRWQENSAKILLLTSLRSEALQPTALSGMPSLIEWLAQMERELVPYHLQLGPISKRDTVEMVLSVLEPSDRDFANWVFNETNGQPFYLLETLKDLLERRALHPKQRDDGKWSFEVDAKHDLGKSVRVPSTVRAVIRSRLSRLSPNAFTLLTAAAILEQRLTFEHLIAIANISEDLGLPALDEIVSVRLLWEDEQPDAPSTYTFANDMIRDVIYTEAGDARRRLFHKRALDLLEKEKKPAAVLAHHAVAAGLAEAAFRYSLTAGQEALRLAAANEARMHLEKARQLVLEGSLPSMNIQPHIRDLFLQLARAYEMGGQPDKAQSAYEELQRLSPQ